MTTPIFKRATPTAASAKSQYQAPDHPEPLAAPAEQEKLLFAILRHPMKIRRLAWFRPLLLLAITLGFASGCASDRGPIQKPPDPEVSSKGGIHYSVARRSNSHLRVGIPEERVLEVFGQPDRREFFIGGTATPTQWDGVRWFYHWQFSGGNATLTILFRRPSADATNREGHTSAILRDWEWTHWMTVPDVPER